MVPDSHDVMHSKCLDRPAALGNVRLYKCDMCINTNCRVVYRCLVREDRASQGVLRTAKWHPELTKKGCKGCKELPAVLIVLVVDFDPGIVSTDLIELSHLNWDVEVTSPPAACFGPNNAPANLPRPCRAFCSAVPTGH